MAFFPFKDKGIDMIAIKKNNIELYQLKARNELVNYKNTYWFMLRKDLTKLSKFKNKNLYFILCALQPNQQDFHFFKLPYKVVRNYFNKKHYENSKFLEIKRINENEYKLRPKYIKIDINKYRLK